jgi:hypothetical protein
MSISFEKNNYFHLINKDEKTIIEYAKIHSQFSYGDVTYGDFAAQVDSEGWLERKLVALPLAFWSGVVMTIYHLAQALFSAVVCDADKTLYLYSVGRDFQESFGRVVSLFNDTYGQYHIQESQFNKTCYECFEGSDVVITEPKEQNHYPKFSSGDPDASILLAQYYLNEGLKSKELFFLKQHARKILVHEIIEIVGQKVDGPGYDFPLNEYLEKASDKLVKHCYSKIKSSLVNHDTSAVKTVLQEALKDNEIQEFLNQLIVPKKVEVADLDEDSASESSSSSSESSSAEEERVKKAKKSAKKTPQGKKPIQGIKPFKPQRRF